MADALRLELAPWHIGVALIEPGSIATPIWKKSDAEAQATQRELGSDADAHYGPAMRAMREAAAETGRRGIPPDAVAAVVEHALISDNPRTRYLVGRDARIRAALASVLPDRLRDRLVARTLKLPRPSSGQ
jgi:NAD(P)-dependent dehydrogenase (short-subunit alcohol dehydrogenase family)